MSLQSRFHRSSRMLSIWIPFGEYAPNTKVASYGGVSKHLQGVVDITMCCEVNMQSISREPPNYFGHKMNTSF